MANSTHNRISTVQSWVLWLDSWDSDDWTVEIRVVHVETWYTGRGVRAGHFSTGSLSKVILLFKPESKPKNKGIQTTNNPAQHVNRTTVMWWHCGHPTYCSGYTTPPPPCVMTTGVWNGTVGPNFGHSGVRESLLTQIHRKPRLRTVEPLSDRCGRGVCPMTPHTHRFHVKCGSKWRFDTLSSWSTHRRQHITFTFIVLSSVHCGIESGESCWILEYRNWLS